MKIAFALLAASALTAGCVTSAPQAGNLAEEKCAFRSVASDMTSRWVTTSASKQHCRQMREESERYAERAWRQRTANAEPPSSPAELPSF